MNFSLQPVTRNALLNYANRDAAYRQDQDLHEETLNQFIQPGMTPAEEMDAVLKGEQAERELPQYWDDSTPRLPLNAGSSWIRDIEYQPNLGITTFTIGGKRYYKPMTDDEVGDMITSDSIGGYYNDYLRGR